MIEIYDQGRRRECRCYDYIALYQGDEKSLADSLQHIQQTVKFMLSAVI